MRVARVSLFPHDLVDGEACWVGEPAAGFWRHRERGVRFGIGQWRVAADSGRAAVSLRWARHRDKVVVGGMVGWQEGRLQLVLLTRKHAIKWGTEEVVGGG